MKESGGTLVKHYKDLAFMGFFEVLTNIFKILKNFSLCKNDIIKFSPDKIIFIDYPGFNLRIAKWAKKKKFKTFYYISPQVWAWKENRVSTIKKYIDHMYVIMPFEKNFYKEKYNYEVQYYGHPLVDIIDESLKNKEIIKNVKPIIAILPGSRKQEINSTLNKVLSIVKDFKKYQFIIAGLNHINKNIYNEAVAKSGASVKVLYNKTYDLLKDSGVFLLHTIGQRGVPTATSPWIRKYIFPGGYIPSLSDIIHETEKLNINITDIEILRLHYAHTLTHWYKNVQKNKSQIINMFDERFYRMWEFYLLASKYSFVNMGNVVFQIQFSKNINNLPLTRNYMYN